MKRVALLLPFWLVFAIGEPSLVHRCPAHDAAFGGEPTASHGGHAQGHGESRHDAPSHSCTCIGLCTTGSPAVVPGITWAPVAAVTLREPDVPAARLFSARVQAHRALPFANGPPG